MYREHQIVNCSRTWRGLILSVLVSLLALTACGSQGAGSGTTSGSAPRSSSVPPELTADFALLRKPAEGLPASMTRVIGEPVPGMDWGLARQVRAPVSGTYWLAPGRRNVCLIATQPNTPVIGTVCATVAQTLRHGIANTSLNRADGRRTIVGVVPDGTRTVTIESGKSNTSVSATHGLFVHRDSVLLPPDRFVLH